MAPARDRQKLSIISCVCQNKNRETMSKIMKLKKLEYEQEQDFFQSHVGEVQEEVNLQAWNSNLPIPITPIPIP